MPLSVLNHPELQSEAAAYEFVEAKRWPNGPECPHCGTVGRAYALKGKTARIGLRKCAGCRKTFTVKVGTIFEDSHVPMHKWLQAIHLMCSSKKGISSHQLHRILGVTLKTPRFISDRLREAIRDVSLGPLGCFGSATRSRPTRRSSAVKRACWLRAATRTSTPCSLSWSAVARSARSISRPWLPTRSARWSARTWPARRG